MEDVNEGAGTEAAEVMDAEAIAAAVRDLEYVTRKRAIADVLATLREGWPIDEAEDTWQAGFASAIEVIEANFVS